MHLKWANVKTKRKNFIGQEFERLYLNHFWFRSKIPCLCMVSPKEISLTHFQILLKSKESTCPISEWGNGLEDSLSLFI